METDKWKSFHRFLQLSSNPASNLEKEITHVFGVNFNKIVLFGNKTPQRNSGTTPRRLRTLRLAQLRMVRWLNQTRSFLCFDPLRTATTKDFDTIARRTATWPFDAGCRMVAPSFKLLSAFSTVPPALDASAPRPVHRATTKSNDSKGMVFGLPAAALRGFEGSQGNVYDLCDLLVCPALDRLR